MNLNFNDDHLSIICIYQETKAPPKFCNLWGATSVCEQIYIIKKICNMTCYIHTTSEKEYDGQDLKVGT
jgi:hypothetical protein